MSRGKSKRWHVTCLMAAAAVLVIVWIVLSNAYSERMRRITARKASALREIHFLLTTIATSGGPVSETFKSDKYSEATCSWRAMIVAYEVPFAKIDYGMPWTSQSNNSSRTQSVPMFALNSTSNHTPGSTVVVAIVGPGTAFDSIRRTTNAVNNTDCRLLLVEIGDGQVNWLEPRDLNVSDLSGGQSASNLPIRLKSPRFMALFADGAIWSISDDIPKAELQKLAVEQSVSREQRDMLLHPYGIEI
jgi:hypothetical protein